MSTSTINHFIQLLMNAFKGLDADVPMIESEKLAMLIHQSMDHDRRIYHTSSHLFEVCEGMNPRQTLAALFHDIVYYQLDRGFPRNTSHLLDKIVRIESQGLVLEAYSPEDLPVCMCAAIFGFKPGDTLPLFGGMNEFLSAVLAIRLLQPLLPTMELLAIAACIEATLPFRGPDANGREFPELLAMRVRDTARALAIPLTDAELSVLVTDAVILANRDVMSFSVADPGNFLSTTWMLIEESNAPLNAVGTYSIQEYRGALQRMEQFLRSLNPEHIFHCYQNTPDAAEMAVLHEAARGNIRFAVSYIGAKIVGIAVIEALALITGGDCSVAMFLGDIRSKQGKPLRAESFLPPMVNDKPIDADLLRVLEIGRTYESTNDLTSSPMTAYMCRRLGQEGMLAALTQAKRMFGGEISPQSFLDSLEPDLVKAVASACENIALSRSAALSALLGT